MAYIEVPKNRSLNIKNDVSFPFNLIADVFHMETQKEIESITDRSAAGAFIAMSLLPEEEKTVLMLWYERRLPNSKISETLGVTVDRARMLREKALRRLSHPSRSRYIRNGFLADEDEREKYRSAGYESGYKDGLESGISICLTDEECAARKQVAVDRLIKAGNMEELNLCTRSRTFLRHAGCWTIADVLALTREQILAIHGFGVGSIRNVADALHNLGIGEDSAWEELRLELEAKAEKKARCSKSC